jgi:hypothetical protein
VRSILISFALLAGACHVEAADEPPPAPTAPARVTAIARIEPRLPDPAPEVEAVDDDAELDDTDEAPEVVPEAAPITDVDSDDLVDAVDRCPDDPEDRDGFDDDDGCPDVEHDADPVL